LSKLLKRKAYDKIYVCMGINDLGYDMDMLKGRFTDFIAMLQEQCPSAIIIIISNLHVGKARSDRDKWVNNTRLNELNAHFESMQDGKKVFYIETNGLFDNADGDMDTTYTNDNVHILGKYYTVWGDYIKAHAIIGSAPEE
ncbi:MAG: lipase, partial [Firmicutes bacterium]|nr:lipase [Bacillota bacterium]